MKANIFLLHGYSGSPIDLLSLEKILSGRFTESEIENFQLPGHGNPQEVPSFNEDLYLKALADKLGSLSDPVRKQIYIGHSTGGTLLLRYVRDSGIVPDLLILIGIPAYIDISFIERWSIHSDGGKAISFSSTAKMVSFINRQSKLVFETPFPVLILNGEDDELVPPDHALVWRERLGTSSRVVIIPSGKHHLTGSTAVKFCADTIIRAVEDIISWNEPDDMNAASGIAKIEPELLNL